MTRADVLATLKLVKDKLGEDTPIYTGRKAQTTQFYPSWSPMLDYVFGGKGIPAGRIMEIFGSEGSGKTSICLRFIADVQRRKGVCVFVDAERSLDIEYAKKLGVDADTLTVVNSSNGEEVIGIISAFLKLSDPPQMIVVDSVAAITSSIEIDEGMDDARPALNARMWNKAMRIWNAINKSSTIILINQVRYGIGGMGRNLVVGGGMGIKFHASIRAEIRMGEWIKEGEVVIGHKIRARTVKNKATGHTFRSGELDWYYDNRSTFDDELAAVATMLGIVQKKGAWIVADGKKLQGLPAFKKELKTNQKFAEKLRRQIYGAKPSIEHIDDTAIKDGEV